MNIPIIESRIESIPKNFIFYAPVSMQSTQLPKISLLFKKRSLLKPILNLSNTNTNFTELIPDKITKQVARIKRETVKENASDINLKDGGVLKKSSLINLRANLKNDHNYPENFNSQNNSSHTLRKIRIESNIHAELVNLFSTSSIPKLLRNDYALWIIGNVIIIFCKNI